MREYKTAVVTGATGGLGRELCRELAARKIKMILLCRSKVKFDNLVTFIKNEYPDAELEYVFVSLDSMDSVKKAVAELISVDADLLVLNAGAYSIPRKTTDSGLDNVFQINFVSQYYIAKKLMPVLRKNHGKVLVTGSIAHRYSVFDKNDVDFGTRRKSSLVYGNSKRCLMYALYELFKAEQEVTFSLCHPGITFTNITSHYPKLIFALIKYPMKVIFIPPRVAAKSLSAGLDTETDCGEWIGPCIFDIWGLPKKRRIKDFSPSEAKEIFEKSENIYNGLD